MSDTMQKNGEARPEMDDLLHDYFQAELPHPWPAFKAPRQKHTSLWSRSAGRIALAACIALLVAGYLTLGGFFPTSQAPTDTIRRTGEIGYIPKDDKKAITTPKVTPPTEEPTPMGHLNSNKK